MKKRLLLLLLTLTMAVAATACGGEEEVVVEVEEEVEVEEPVVEEEAVVEDVVPEGFYRSELTNEIISEELKDQRPIAVMDDNVLECKLFVTILWV